MIYTRIILITGLFSFTGFLKAQSVSPEVISSCGEHFANSAGSLSWTLGEPVVETFQNVSNTLTQGFHQNYYGVIGIEEISNDINISVFPNPSAGLVNISFSKRDHGYTTVSVSDMTGKQVQAVEIMGQQALLIDASSYENGMYLITISDQFNKQQTVTLIKNK